MENSTMNKIIVSLLVSFACLAAQAQNHIAQSVLRVQALATGTNGFGITNLSCVLTNLGMIYSTNVVYTNQNRVLRSNGTTTNTVSTQPLFDNIALWPNRDGGPNVFSGAFSGSVIDNPTNYPVSTMTLFIAIASPWGTNGPIGVNFCPKWEQSLVPTSTADDWSIRIPGNSSAYQTIATNIPVWKWPGAEYLAVRNITNQFIQAGDTAVTNAPYIVNMTVVGFR